MNPWAETGQRQIGIPLPISKRLDDWREKMVPFTEELCMHLVKEWEVEGADPAGAGGTVGPSTAAHHLGELVDPWQCIWAVILPGTQPDAPMFRALRKRKCWASAFQILHKMSFVGDANSKLCKEGDAGKQP